MKIKLRHWKRRWAMLLAGFVGAGLAGAEPVPVGDYSFETNSLSAGGYAYNLGPEWQETAGPNNSAGFEEYIVGFVAEGTDHLGVELNHDVWQDLPATYAANTRYTLTVAVGYRNGQTQPGNQSRYLLADTNGTIFATGSFDAATLAPQTFGDAPALVFDTPTAPAAVGKNIRILLQARGVGRSHFDNLRLETTPLTPPGGATVINLPATNLTTTTATLRGQITDIGNAAPVVTLFYGGTDGGLNPSNWANARVLPGTQTGVFATNLSGLLPGTEYFYTARASNSAGVSWAIPAASFELLPELPQVQTVAASDITPTGARLGAEVLNTGGQAPQVTIYYGMADGGGVPGAWAASVSLGTQTGAGSAVVGGLAPGSVYFFRAFATNGAGGVWAGNTLLFATATVTLPAVNNRSVEGVTGTTANLRGEVTATGGDTPWVTIFYGPADGGTNAGGWAQSAELGLRDGTFTRFVGGLATNTPHFYRCRATNLAGAAWAATAESFTTTGLIPTTAVINEFHYKPADKTSLEEFIELHNPGDAAIDLSGWRFASAVSYTFPASTVLPPGGYLVV